MKIKAYRYLQGVIILLLICCALLSAYLINGVRARYLTQADSDSDARVAKFVFDITDVTENDKKLDSLTLDLSDVNYPGTSKTYVFTLTNEKGGALSEVAQAVSAKITLTGELPLDITLQDGAKELSFENDTSVKVAEFKAGEAQTKTLSLTVTWSATKNDPAYSGKRAKVTVSLLAEQID